MFRSTDGNNWTDISGNFPDIPTNSIKALADGSLVVGTDLGVIYGRRERPGAARERTAVDGRDRRRAGPDDNIYAATHGRGIWRIAQPAT